MEKEPEIIPDRIVLNGLSRKELSQKLGVTPARLRQVTSQLRKVAPEFNFLPGDRLMTYRDYDLFIKFWRLAKIKTFPRAIAHIQKYGL